MSRLPRPGQDNGNWGTILNDFLDQSHNEDGSIKDSVIAGKEDISNKSTNVTTDGTSDTKYPSVKAVKDYVDPIGTQVETVLQLTSIGSPFVGSDTFKAKVQSFSALFNNTDNAESFLFFTDPHLAEGASYESQFVEYMTLLRKCYQMSPVSFAACGGDWLGSNDTQQEACFKLGYIDGVMRSMFDKYHLILGNHDTNYQGVDESKVASSGELMVTTIRNLWYRNTGNSYYSFDGLNTKFYALDSYLDWGSGAMRVREWEQIAWLAGKLLADDVEHSAILIHMYYESGTTVSAFAANLGALCAAYNAHTSVQLNSITYNFSACTGKMEFMMAGHAHVDFNTTQNGIPVIGTTHFRDGDIPSYDLVLVDYDARQINLVRVGTGSDRTVALA